MGLTIPNLDRYDFETVKEEVMAKLPAYSSRWTEYNASDPGVTLLELLAWMADINSYRLNHLGEEHYRAFLSLLDAEKTSEQSLQEAFLALKETLAIPGKAVTLKDFEYLAKATPDVTLAKVKAKAYPDENRVSVVIVPDSDGQRPGVRKAIREKVTAFLETKKLLTTRVEVTDNVSYVPVNVRLHLHTRLGDPDLLRQEVEVLLKKFLDPLHGGVENKGWDFGEDIHVSHIYMMLKEVKEIEKIDMIYFSSGQAVSVTVPAMSLPTSGRHFVQVKSIKALGDCP